MFCAIFRFPIMQNKNKKRNWIYIWSFKFILAHISAMVQPRQHGPTLTAIFFLKAHAFFICCQINSPW